jgi:hypothetical protein
MAHHWGGKFFVLLAVIDQADSEITFNTHSHVPREEERERHIQTKKKRYISSGMGFEVEPIFLWDHFSFI